MAIALLLIHGATFAQDGRQGWLVDTMYRSGKINSVLAVVAVLIAEIGRASCRERVYVLV